MTSIFKPKSCNKILIDNRTTEVFTFSLIEVILQSSITKCCNNTAKLGRLKKDYSSLLSWAYNVNLLEMKLR